MRTTLIFIFAVVLAGHLRAQADTCSFAFQKYSIRSTHLNAEREHWVSLPMRYDSSKTYPVLYVLDAEWRFDLVRNIAWDLEGNKKIPGHIIVGLPHVETEYQRGIDLTFSESRTEYDGEAVDSTWYNAKNSGGGMLYYRYLTQELIPHIESHYPCNGENILVGHSYGGYFAGYLLSLPHSFSALQIYDPSIWYSNGEVITRLEQAAAGSQNVHVFVSYQSIPKFHSQKIERFIRTLRKRKNLVVVSRKYKHETHNALFMYSFLEGMEALYGNANHY